MNWKLVRSLSGDPEIDDWGPPELSLLALIAREPDSGLEEVAPGTYLVTKLPEPDEPPLLDPLEWMLGDFDGRDGVKRLRPGVWQVPSGWV